MKTPHVFLLCLAGLLLACLPVQTLRAQLFLRPGLQYLKFTQGEYDDKAAVSMSLGTCFGSEKQHELALEFVHSEWDYTKAQGTLSPGSFFGDKADGSLDEVLVNYRRYFDTGFAGLRGYLGASLGAARVDGDLDRSLSGTKWLGSYNSTRATAGALVGACYSFGKSCSLDAFVRYSVLSNPDVRVQLSGSSTTVQNVPIADMNMLTFGLGLHFSF